MLISFLSFRAKLESSRGEEDVARTMPATAGQNARTPQNSAIR